VSETLENTSWSWRSFPPHVHPFPSTMRAPSRFACVAAVALCCALLSFLQKIITTAHGVCRTAWEASIFYFFLKYPLTRFSESAVTAFSKFNVQHNVLQCSMAIWAKLKFHVNQPALGLGLYGSLFYYIWMIFDQKHKGCKHVDQVPESDQCRKYSKARFYSYSS